MLNLTSQQNGFYNHKKLKQRILIRKPCKVVDVILFLTRSYAELISIILPLFLYYPI